MAPLLRWISPIRSGRQSVLAAAQPIPAAVLGTCIKLPLSQAPGLEDKHSKLIPVDVDEGVTLQLNYEIETLSAGHSIPMRG
ncbi:hypothetical protein chiPu_0000335 [Chiloscyllium punctatum]|uniref:Uncharacterized protein n=1 Tax=Chiloscyllium punctatum TaxID=137246 RepID=A0A401RV03_CHIPU|nr:hypothetical protein [Chiloscyllium punctatum]